MSRRISLLAFLGASLLLAGCGKKDVVSNQCPDSARYSNITDPDLDVVLPNGISPNGDGRNDRFMVFVRSKSNPQNPPTFTMQRLRVMRPGIKQPVYDNPNYRNTFDGHNSAGQELAEGDYLCEVTLDNNLLRSNLKIVRTSKACSCIPIDLLDPNLDAGNCQ
jgi:CHU_C Type IX secretion signal domain